MIFFVILFYGLADTILPYALWYITSMVNDNERLT